jgi:bisanhydrobacterioruberin hydratase
VTGSRVQRYLLLVSGALYLVMWIGGIVAYVFRGGPGPHEAWTAPAFLALAAILVLGTSRRREALLLTVALVLGFISEYLAVQCGCVFGPYSYTDVLSPRVLGIPLVMSAAWMIVVAYVKVMLMRITSTAWTEVAAASLWMTAIDLVIDPVAAGPLRYWSWVNPGAYYGIPASNFVGWVLVSAVIFAVLQLAPGGWADNPWAGRIGLSVIIFFTVIAGSYGLVLCATAGGRQNRKVSPTCAFTNTGLKLTLAACASRSSMRSSPPSLENRRS